MPQACRTIARKHVICSQILSIFHHGLVVPSILVPVIASFDASAAALRYIILTASAASALALTLKLDLRSYKHLQTALRYLELAYDLERGTATDIDQRIMQIMREVPMLPWCCCGLRVTDLVPGHLRPDEPRVEDP